MGGFCQFYGQPPNLPSPCQSGVWERVFHDLVRDKKNQYLMIESTLVRAHQQAATRLVDGIPSVGIDWFNYGGLTRDVSLVSVPAAFIDDYDVHLAHGQAWQPGNTEITGYVHVLDAPAGTSVTVDIPEAGAETTCTTDADGNALFSVKAGKLTLWSPESPKLYKVNLATVEDKITDDIGFHDIRVDGTRILLNGNAVFLQGANMHAEAHVRGGRANTDEDVSTIFSYL